MDVSGKIKNFLEKLRALPENKKKIILWSVVAVTAIVMGFFWIKSAASSVSQFGKEMQKIELPEFESIEAPKFDLDAIEEKIKQEQVKENEKPIEEEIFLDNIAE